MRRAMTTRLAVKVSPGASRNAIRRWLRDTLKLSVTAAPERGRASAAVEVRLAGALGVPASAVTVAAGHGATRKGVEFAGLSAESVRARLAG